MKDKEWTTKNTATGHPDHDRLWIEEQIREESEAEKMNKAALVVSYFPAGTTPRDRIAAVSSRDSSAVLHRARCYLPKRPLVAHGLLSIAQ